MNRSIHAVSMTLFYVQSTHAKEQWGVHHRASLSRNSTQSEFHLSGAGKVEDANENRWSLGFTQTTSWNTKAQTIIGYGICNLEMQLFFFFLINCQPSKSRQYRLHSLKTGHGPASSDKMAALSDRTASLKIMKLLKVVYCLFDSINAGADQATTVKV